MESTASVQMGFLFSKPALFGFWRTCRTAVLSGLFAIGAQSPGWTAGSWETRHDLPVPTSGLHASTLDGKIYAVGGQNWNDPSLPAATGALWIYDPVEDRWSEGASMPTGRIFLDTVVVDGLLYAIGGATQGVEHAPGLAVVEAYDPRTDTWTRKADMPTPRADLTVSAAGDKIFAIGGTRNVGVDALTIVEEYDPTTDTWSRKADMPTPRLHLASGVVKDRIYVFGGSPEWPVPLSTTEAYDPVTDTWTKAANMPTERTGLWAATLDGNIYVMGGVEWDSEALATVEAYDPVTDTWAAMPDMPTPRTLFTAAAVGNEIYAIGGATSDFNSLASVEALRPD